MCVYFFFNAYFYLFLHFKYLEILCIFPTYWNKKNYKDIIYVCVYLYWRTTLKSFFFTKRFKIILVLSMDQKLPMTILKLRSIDFMKRFFFFLRKKREDWLKRDQQFFLFLRNHNKNFGWKLCLIPLDSVN